MKTLDKKIYSAREAFQYIPQIASEPSMRKFIEEDMRNKNILGASIQKVGKQKRFFVSKENLEKAIENMIIIDKPLKMSIRKYKQTQEAKFGAFFVMAHIFDSMLYDTYVIVEKNTDTQYIFKHDKIQKHLEKNPGDRDSRINFANGKQFIRLRLNLAEKQ
ncbi:TPA: hypothetical protein DIU22_03990 [Candidatus Woesebacteria bacterium]|nr:hypothetical protein [Candidatus Woesebacteria bacterium]